MRDSDERTDADPTAADSETSDSSTTDAGPDTTDTNATGSGSDAPGTDPNVPDQQSDTPGTHQEEIDEDARLLGNEPDPEAVDEPTTSSEQEAQETYWMAKEMAAVGIVSIFGVVLVAFGLLQATGLVELPAAIGDSAIAHWSLFVVLGAVLVAAFAWTQWQT